jgi:integrase
VRFHDLRRIWATLLLCLGVSARVVIDILGHTQISVNTYDHVMPSMRHKATGQIDAALGSLDEARSEDEED